MIDLMNCSALWDFLVSNGKIRKSLTPEKIAVIILNCEKCEFYLRVMLPKDANGMTNRVDLIRAI